MSNYKALRSDPYEKETYPVEYNPLPLTKDYLKGYFMRYFVQPKADISRVIEIDKKQYDDYWEHTSGININAYTAVELKWKLTGQAYDTYKNNIRISPGVWHSNERILKIKEKKMPLLSAIIKDFARFAMLSQDIISPSGITTRDEDHQHLYRVDEKGNGWAVEIQQTENPKIKHKHKIVNWEVHESQSNCYPNCKAIYGHKGSGPHTHNINKK